MAIDDMPAAEVRQEGPNSDPTSGAKFAVIFLVLAALAVGEFFTVHRMNEVRNQVTAQQEELREDLTGQLRDQVSNRLSAMEQQNTQDLNAVKAELDDAAKRVGAQGGELKHARSMVAQLQNQERDQTEQLKQELDQKA